MVQVDMIDQALIVLTQAGEARTRVKGLGGKRPAGRKLGGNPVDQLPSYRYRFECVPVYIPFKWRIIPIRSSTRWSAASLVGIPSRRAI